MWKFLKVAITIIDLFKTHNYQTKIFENKSQKESRKRVFSFLVVKPIFHPSLWTHFQTYFFFKANLNPECPSILFAAKNVQLSS